MTKTVFPSGLTWSRNQIPYFSWYPRSDNLRYFASFFALWYIGPDPACWLQKEKKNNNRRFYLKSNNLPFIHTGLPWKAALAVTTNKFVQLIDASFCPHFRNKKKQHYRQTDWPTDRQADRRTDPLIVTSRRCQISVKMGISREKSMK